jgi:hypothetical protein
MEWFGTIVKQLVHHFGTRFYIEKALYIESPNFLIQPRAEHRLGI